MERDKKVINQSFTVFVPVVLIIPVLDSSIECGNTMQWKRRKAESFTVAAAAYGCNSESSWTDSITNETGVFSA